LLKTLTFFSSNDSLSLFPMIHRETSAEASVVPSWHKLPSSPSLCPRSIIQPLCWYFLLAQSLWRKTSVIQHRSYHLSSVFFCFGIVVRPGRLQNSSSSTYSESGLHRSKPRAIDVTSSHFCFRFQIVLFLKNAVFWGVTPCRCCRLNCRLGG
jgi:hypothetical protein